MTPASRSVLVGIGNPYAGDDAIGLRVAQLLQQRLDTTRAIDLIESSASAFGVVEAIEGYSTAILVDAVEDNSLPVGTVLRVESLPGAGARGLNLHTAGLPDALVLARRMGMAVPWRITIIGIVIRPPGRFADSLSTELLGRLSSVVEAAHGLITMSEQPGLA